MRTKYSMLNAIFGIVGQVLIALAGFVSRKVFIDSLTMDMQGLNSALTSIISMLSLSELGIGSAIICNLYRPLAEDDRPKIISLMQLYGKLYKIISAAVLTIGLCIIPFLPMIIGDNGAHFSQMDLTFYFLFFLAESAMSYLLAYKRSIIIADQKNFIVLSVRTLSMLSKEIAQIVILITTRNFMLFLAVKMCFTLIENIVISFIADKKYPYIKTKTKIPVDAEVKKNIIGNTKALAMHCVGNYMINNVDMIIITNMLGTEQSGIYSSYYLITATLRTVFAQFSAGFTASFGNIIATGDKENLYAAFKKTMFVSFLLVNFVAISLFCLFNDFIVLWLKRGASADIDVTLAVSVVLVICLNFFITCMAETLGSLRASAGLFRPDRYLHIILALFNIGACILFVNLWGIIGVFIGTFVCKVIKEVIVLPYIVYKHIFEKKFYRYQLVFLRYFFTTVVLGALTFYLCSLVGMGGIVGFIIKCGICLVVPNVLTVLMYCRTIEFKFLLVLLSRVFGRLKSLRRIEEDAE